MDLAAKLQKLVVGKEVEGLTMGTEATAFYRRLLKGNTRPTDELNASVQCTMTASVANQGQGELLREVNLPREKADGLFRPV